MVAAPELGGCPRGSCRGGGGADFAPGTGSVQGPCGQRGSVLGERGWPVTPPLPALHTFLALGVTGLQHPHWLLHQLLQLLQKRTYVWSPQGDVGHFHQRLKPRILRDPETVSGSSSGLDTEGKGLGCARGHWMEGAPYTEAHPEGADGWGDKLFLEGGIGWVSVRHLCLILLLEFWQAMPPPPRTLLWTRNLRVLTCGVTELGPCQAPQWGPPGPKLPSPKYSTTSFLACDSQ